jgi:hypothetical protein
VVGPCPFTAPLPRLFTGPLPTPGLVGVGVDVVVGVGVDVVVGVVGVGRALVAGGVDAGGTAAPGCDDGAAAGTAFGVVVPRRLAGPTPEGPVCAGCRTAPVVSEARPVGATGTLGLLRTDRVVTPMPGRWISEKGPCPAIPTAARAR